MLPAASPLAAAKNIGHKVQQNRNAVSISFSGIDGAGKSTQIHHLSERLREIGLHVSRITFWTDVAAFTRLREIMSHSVFHGDRGIGRPDRPVRRRDKNVNAWYLTLFRCSLYLIDVVKLKVVSRSIRNQSRDIVIFDRYIYDELANLPLDHWLTRRFVQLLLAIAPRPDLPLLLNADPAEACIRKPEYPEEFLHRNRASFLDLAKMADVTVIDVRSVDETASRVEESLAQILSDLPNATCVNSGPISRNPLKSKTKTAFVKTRVY
jgi:thymidylate kinase